MSDDLFGFLVNVGWVALFVVLLVLSFLVRL